MKKLLLPICVALVSTSGIASAAGDVNAGKAKMQERECFACHGKDGNSKKAKYPKLAGQHASYVEKQLSDFVAGDRKNATMSQEVEGLTATDIANLAAFFASQTVVESKTPEEYAELGKAIYHGGNPKSGVPACMSCHAPNGTGNEAANFPSLSGQHAGYVAKAMKDFRSGTRANDAGHMMRNIASRMTDAEIEAVAYYVGGLR